MVENLELCHRESQENSCAEIKSLKSSVKEQDAQICSLQKTICRESEFSDIPPAPRAKGKLCWYLLAAPY